MAEDVKLNISGNMSKLKGQLSKADADIKKRTNQIDQLKAKIKQTEAKMAAMKAQVGGLAKGVGVGLGTAAITLAVQDTFTSAGLEGSPWIGGATAVAAGAAFGGPVGAATAALAVGVSELTRYVGELSLKIKAMEQKTVDQVKRTSELHRSMHNERRRLDKLAQAQAELIEKAAEKKVKIMSHNIARMMIAGRGA